MIARASRDDTPRNAIIRPPARVAGTEPATTLAGLTTREEGRTTGDRGDAARGARVRRTLVLLARGAGCLRARARRWDRAASLPARSAPLRPGAGRACLPHALRRSRQARHLRRALRAAPGLDRAAAPASAGYLAL